MARQTTVATKFHPPSSVYYLEKLYKMLSDQEFNALHDLYNSTYGEGWVWQNVSSSVPWNFSIPNVNPCEDKWQGVGCSCTSKRCSITKIYLSNHNMSGHLPLSIGSFPSLQSLSFHSNNISGTLPTTIGNLTKLEALDLSINRFVRELPKQIEHLQSLQNLDLSLNAFTEIPVEFFKLTKLRILSLAVNSRTGPISPSFGNFHSLVSLHLEGNYFSQSLPDIFASFPALETLNIAKNGITGSLPPSFYAMHNLSSLTIFSTLMTSTLSPAIGNLTNLHSLYLYDNLFHGSLPESVGNLTKLIDCMLKYNLFTGPLPSSMAALTNLHFLYIQENSFTGNVSFLTGLTRLNELSCGENFFTGTFLVQPNQFLQLRLFNNSYNSFSGPMPWNENWGMGNYGIHDNYFSGVLPHGNSSVSEMEAYQDCANLIYLFTDHNYLTGTIPEYFYLSCPRGFNFNLADNYLTGTISQNISSLTSLNQWNVSLNYLTGTIPAEIGNLANIAVMDFGNNQFTGRLPPSVQEMQLLEELFIQNNQLSGSLNLFLGGEIEEMPVHMMKLRNINLSGNKFTGSLPGNFFATSTSLQSFAATSNCLSGSIPKEVCSASFLSSLSLDGLSTAENCRVPLFSAVSPLFSGFAVSHFLPGPIPPCLYEMQGLQLLHLSGNGLTGSLPSNISLPDTLTDLSLSHNALTGTIPLSIQNKYWDNLDLSFNKLTGTLSSRFAGVFDPSENQELYLEVNRLSGNIPSSFQNITNLAVLNGNIFSCGWNGENLPKHDSDYSDYSCGSDSVNYVLFGGLWALLLFPVIFLILFRYLSKSFTLASGGGDSHDVKKPGVDNISPNGRDDLSIVNPSDAGRIARSSLINRLVGFLSLNAIYQQLLVWKWEVRREILNETLNLVRLSVFLNELRRSVLLMTAYCVCILLPLYCIIKKFEASYSVEYAWYVGGVLLSGEIAAVLLFLALVGFLMLIYFLLGERLTNRVNNKAPKSDERELNIQINASNDSSSVKIGKTEMNKDFEVFERTASVSGVRPLVGVKETTRDSLIVTLNYTLVFIFDLIIMGIVDFSYVFIVISYSNTIVTMAAFGLAVFRLITNNLLLSKAIPVSIYILTSLIPAWKELYFFQQKYPGNVKNVLAYYTYRDISFLDNLILFNNIILPVLATIFILPDCFYNALFAAPDVSSHYSFDQCEQYVLPVNVGRLCTLQIQTMSYSPPYIYSFQCSSKVVINYASVYILMFIMAGFIPLMKLALKLYYDNVVIKNIPSVSTPTRLQRNVKFYVEKLLPNYYRQLRETREQESTTIEKRQGKPEQFVLFSKLRLTVKINSYLTILATFGALFPPLAVVGCLTIFTITYFEELSIGWLLAETRAKKYFWYEEQLNHEAENVEKSSNFTLWSTLTVSSFFYGCIVFDIMGDTAGWKAALPMTILLFFFPLLLYMFITWFSKCQESKYWKSLLFFGDCDDICRLRKQKSLDKPDTAQTANRLHRATEGGSSQIELTGRPSKEKQNEKDSEVIVMANPIHDDRNKTDSLP
jgi:Leucine-rich repeat (LRR) protein